MFSCQGWRRNRISTLRVGCSQAALPPAAKAFGLSDSRRRAIFPLACPSRCKPGQPSTCIAPSKCISYYNETATSQNTLGWHFVPKKNRTKWSTKGPLMFKGVQLKSLAACQEQAISPDILSVRGPQAVKEVAPKGRGRRMPAPCHDPFYEKGAPCQSLRLS